MPECARDAVGGSDRMSGLVRVILPLRRVGDHPGTTTLHGHTRLQAHSVVRLSTRLPSTACGRRDGRPQWDL
ncbi:predicted protein [Streptomyces albidoflavus]|nr:predicted protein [Streptomyces albidoflavus]